MAVLDWVLLKFEVWHSIIGLVLVAIFLATLLAAVYASWSAYHDRFTPRK